MVETSAGSDDRVVITRDAFESLQQQALLRNLEKELGGWAKERFWYALIIVSVVGFIGIQAIAYLLINQLLGSQIDDAKIVSAVLKEETNRVKNEADDVISEAKIATREAREQAVLVQQKLAELGKQAGELTRILARTDRQVQARIDAYNESIRINISNDIERISTSLRDIINIISSIDNAGSFNVGAKIINAASTVEAIDPFADERAKYYLIIYTDEDEEISAIDVKNRLVSKGYSSSISLDNAPFERLRVVLNRTIIFAPSVSSAIKQRIVEDIRSAIPGVALAELDPRSVPPSLEEMINNLIYNLNKHDVLMIF